MKTDVAEPERPPVVDTLEIRNAALGRLGDIRAEAQRMAVLIIRGALVTQFTNEELHLIAEYMSIGETCDLRKMGLLGEDEGFDG